MTAVSMYGRNNADMTNVPLYVAVITAGAGLIGALIPQAALVIREVRQAEKDRHERFVTATRDACVAVLRAAGELRTLVENIRSYRGDASGMRGRVEDVLNHAEATRLHAASVSLLVPGRLATPADKVAAAARALAEDVVRNTNLDRGVSIGFADTGALDTCITDFRDEAVKYVGEVI
jgi:hypothetical protein